MLNPSQREPVAVHRAMPPPLPEVLEKRRERCLATGFAALGIAVFSIAAILNPYDAEGRPLSHGTHRQLGLPPCLMKQVTGLACPSCGMTTSFSLLMHGDISAAWTANWAGAIAALLGLGATLWMLVVAMDLPKGSYAVDDAVKWLTITGTITALTRWLVMLPSWFGW
jgi:hypothetical protein